MLERLRDQERNKRNAAPLAFENNPDEALGMFWGMDRVHTYFEGFDEVVADDDDR